MATLEQLVVRIEADTERMRRELSRAEQATTASASKIDRAVGTLDQRFQKLTATVARFAGPLAVGALGVTAVNFVRQQAQMADALSHTANRLGVTTSALQEFRFAADQGAGVASQTADLALQRFTRRLGEAQQGTGELTGVLQQYGIAVRDASGQARAADAVLADLADATKGAESSQEQLRIAFKAFDSEGAAFVNILRLGRDGLDDFRRQARESGAVLSDETVARLAEANTEMSRLAQVTRVQFTEAMADLAPVLTSVAQGFATVASWVRRAYDALSEFRLGALYLELEQAQQRLASLQDRAAEIVERQNVVRRQANLPAMSAADLPQSVIGEIREETFRAKAEVDRLAATLRTLEQDRDRAPVVPRVEAPAALGLPTVPQLEAVGAKADELAGRVLAVEQSRIDAYDGYQAAVDAQVVRELRAADEVAAARLRAETEAQREIDRARQEAYREQVRLTGELSDRLVDAGRGFLDALFDQSQDFWQDFADLGRRTLTEIAAEQLFRAPASAFAEGLFGTGGATGGANAGGIAGLAGSLGRSVASSAIADAIGLPSIGEALGVSSLFGGGGGALGSAGLAAAASSSTFGTGAASLVASAELAGLTGGITGGAAASAAGAGAVGGLGAAGGFGSALAAAAPFALPVAALAGAYLLSGGLDRPSVGPNASARLVLENNRFALGPTGADNGGERFLGQAESEALAAAATLNRLIDELGLVVEDVPDAVDLATAFGDSFNRGGRPLVEDVLRSGALGQLSQEQIAAALNDGSIFGAQVEAVRQALQGAGTDGRLREAQRIVDQASREAERRERDRLGQAVDAAREQVEAQRDLVAALSDTGGEVGRLADTLDRDVDALLLSRQSPLSPAARLAEARRQFAQALASGDRDRAAAAGDALTREGASFFGTATSAGAALFDEVVASLRSLEPAQAEAVEVDTEALRVAEQQLAVAADSLSSAEAALAAFERSGEISAEQLAAAERQIEVLAEEQAALDAIQAALEAESPDAAILRQQLDALERVGAGQDPVANAVRELATSLTATRAAAAGAPVTAIGAASAGGDRFAQVAAELQQFRDFNFGFGAFADGGVVRRPTLALIGEAGQDEAVIPLRGGAVPVTITGGASADGIRALVAIGVEQVDALGRMERRLAALEADSRLRGAQRAVGAAA